MRASLICVFARCSTTSIERYSGFFRRSSRYVSTILSWSITNVSIGPTVIWLSLANHQYIGGLAGGRQFQIPDLAKFFARASNRMRDAELPRAQSERLIGHNQSHLSALGELVPA